MIWQSRESDVVLVEVEVFDYLKLALVVSLVENELTQSGVDWNILAISDVRQILCGLVWEVDK